MMGFTEEMKLVTLGKGLVSMIELSKFDNESKALLDDKTTLLVNTTPREYSHTLKLEILSEDGSGHDIYIECHPYQIFKLRNGDECPAVDLKGKRLISIGQNHVYCVNINRTYRERLLYSVRKLERSHIDYVYINGIKVKL